MWFFRFVFHYILLPATCALLGILASFLLKDVFPQVLQRRELTGKDAEVFAIAASAFIAALIAVFVQRMISLAYRGMRGRDYRKRSKKELV